MLTSIVLLNDGLIRCKTTEEVLTEEVLRSEYTRDIDVSNYEK